MDDFNDILTANRAYAENFELAGLASSARLGLGVVTCIDSRIEPLTMLGVHPGDAKILRNAGGRVSDDALRSLVLATTLLGVHRIMVVHHTDCAMGGIDDETMRARVAVALPHADLTTFEPLSMIDPHTSLRADVTRLRHSPLISAQVTVGGFVYDVHTGLLSQVVD